MAQRESRLSTRIIKECKEALGLDLFIFKVRGSEHMMAGLPDLIGCYQGRFFGLEVKVPESRGNTSIRQEYVMGLISRAGGITAVVTSPQEALAILKGAE